MIDRLGARRKSLGVTTSAPPLAQPTSFFLDLLRLIAAFSVFYFHVVLLWYPQANSDLLVRFGHRAVIVFFVLSGYVIAYSTLRKERDPQGYVLSRLSRLYSVLLPALVWTALLQIVGTHLNPAPYLQIDRGHDVLRYGIVALFLQSAWTLNISPPTNGPFWSLCHEFWYYSLFGAAVLIPRRGWKAAAILILALICGMNVLLLMPSWLMGVACYRYGRAVALPRGVAAAGLIATGMLAIASYWFLPDWPYVVPHHVLFYSGSFLSDALFGILLMLMIGFFDGTFRDAQVPACLDKIVRWAADHTFSLYLYHFPLLFFIAAVVPFNRHDVAAASGLIVLTLAVVLALSLITESKRKDWRRLFGAIWDRCAGAKAVARPVR